MGFATKRLSSSGISNQEAYGPKFGSEFQNTGGRYEDFE